MMLGEWLARYYDWKLQDEGREDMEDKLIIDYIKLVELYKILEDVADDFDAVHTTYNLKDIKDTLGVIEGLGKKFDTLCNIEFEKIAPLIKKRANLTEPQLNHMRENHKDFALNGFVDRQIDLDAYFEHIKWYFENLYSEGE